MNMPAADLAKQVRSKIMAAMETKGADDNTLKEALHNVFAETLAQAKSGGSVEESAAQMAKAGVDSMLMLAKDPVRGSVAVMREVSDSATRLGLDSQTVMMAAMVGIARAVPKTKAEQLFKIKQALDEAYHGIGEAFDEAVKKAAQL